MVVEGKVIGRDDVDTGVLLDLPVSKSQPLALGQEVGLGDLVGPVRLIGLLQVSDGPNSSGKSELTSTSHLPLRGNVY